MAVFVTYKKSNIVLGQKTGGLAICYYNSGLPLQIGSCTHITSDVIQQNVIAVFYLLNKVPTN